MCVPIRLSNLRTQGLLFGVITLCALSAAAATEKVLHQFSSQQRGGYPISLVSDSAGNLFGSTVYGGTYDEGEVFEFAPTESGGWKEAVIHSFGGTGDGRIPAQIVLDAEGNIYGTTGYGGASCGGNGCGTVYKLTQNSSGGSTEVLIYSFGTNDGYPTGALAVDAGSIYVAVSNYAAATFSVYGFTPSGDGWTKTILYTFSAGTQYGTIAGLALDSGGNLYGTNVVDGAEGFVFELTPASGGSWTENTLYTFIGGPPGGVPTGPLFLKDGNLFGTTLDGGQAKCEGENAGCGVVFQLTPGSGQWTEKVIYTFKGFDSDGAIYPQLAGFDASGNLYGSTFEGGAGVCSYCGSVFRLAPTGSGWSETDLWDFTGQSDTNYPTALAITPAGQIFGTTEGPGGVDPIEGSIFGLTPASGPAGSWTISILYTFPITDGTEPYAGLFADAAGNLYGTTAYGGQNNIGSVFEISPMGNGWKESLIYSFGPATNQLYFTVFPSGLVADAQGNLYGTTEYGGANQQGSVFELSPLVGGGWQEKDLVTFSSHGALFQPTSGLIFDKAGNMYGVTSHGGAHQLGTVFEVTQGAGGSWTATVIYSFSGYPNDGSRPEATLTTDATGNLFGTAKEGGSGGCLDQTGTPLGCGAVFELSNVGGKGWTETLLHSFLGNTGNDGAEPTTSLIFDTAGNLYGTTYSGGLRGPRCQLLPAGCGIVFELSPSANGWAETILYEFTGINGQGAAPNSALTWDRLGNLYGTTEDGGSQRSGTLFRLSPAAGGGWNQEVIYDFGSGSDGKYPTGNLILGAGGVLYGTNIGGGAAGGIGNDGQGTVFEVVP